MKGPSFIILSMDPSSHGQLGNEDIAALGKQDWRLRGNHLHLRIGLHDLLYACQGQLVYFVVMIIRFQVVDNMLPVSGQDVTRGAL